MAQPAAVPQQAMDPNPQPSDTTPAQPTAPGPPASSEGSVTEKGLGVANGERGASKTSVIEDPADRVVPAALNQTSSSFSSEVDEKKPAKKKRGLFKKKDKEGKGKKDDDDDDLKPISIIRLFRFATPFELTLNMIGMVLACAAGATQPLMTLIFGRLTSAFNDFGRVARRIQEQGMTPENAAAMAAAKVTLRKEAGNNALYLMAIGLGLFLCTYVYMLIWNWTCERQNKRIREKYLHAVLRQEIAYFDELGAGEVATRIMSDCNLVQTGIGEKIPIASSFIATFITGFALAYARQAKLAGAMTSILPVIMLTGAIMGIATTKYTTGSLKWVSKGGTLAEEIISSIRTVQAFGTMGVLGDKFNGLIAKSRAMGIKGSLIEGIGLSIMFFAIYS
jgi:ATP-binding cassette subfamily B (MDR/TAP) protein 1